MLNRYRLLLIGWILVIKQLPTFRDITKGLFSPLIGIERITRVCVFSQVGA